VSNPTSFSNTRNDVALRGTALTVLRVVTGLIFVAYGWQKISANTIAGVTGYFTQLGVPLPELMAPFIAYLEFLGGIALVLGLLTRPLAFLFVCDMIGALFFAHLPSGFYVEQGGLSQVLILGAASLAIALMGPGPYSADRFLFGRQESKASVLA
jgi:putative oxidoreductase